MRKLEDKTQTSIGLHYETVVDLAGQGFLRYMPLLKNLLHLSGFVH